jgi:hypothetical protein
MGLITLDRLSSHFLAWKLYFLNTTWSHTYHGPRLDILYMAGLFLLVNETSFIYKRNLNMYLTDNWILKYSSLVFTANDIINLVFKQAQQIKNNYLKCSLQQVSIQKQRNFFLDSFNVNIFNSMFTSLNLTNQVYFLGDISHTNEWTE